MPLKSITFRPGVSREGTNYANEGGWYACDKVRFRSGFPENIGGWQKFSLNSYTDVCRTLRNWSSIAGNNYTGVGTNIRFFVEFSGTLYNITPYRLTVSPLTPANPLNFVSGQKTVTITYAGHGASTGDYITISGAVMSTSGVPAAEINTDHTITVLDASTFTFQVTTSATATTTDGGSAISLSFEASAGLPINVNGLGWGAGTWSRGTWGSAATSGGVVQPLGYWTQDNYGQDLVIAPTNGEVYYWEISTSVAGSGIPAADAVKLSSLSGAADCPTIVTGIVTTDENHVMALGCNAIGESAKTPMLIRWADQNNPALWTPSIATSAGGYKLTYGDSIITAIKTRQETLIFTDSALYGAQYVGTPYTFNFQPRSTNITIASPFAAISINNITYWMGHKKFFTYGGTVETLPCSLRQYIFNDFNYAQQAQTFVGSVGEFNEIWWFYCSSEAESPDRYAVYNYQERIWYYGNMDRTAWINCPDRTYPIATIDGNLIYQENGLDDNATGTALPISAYIQSADFDLDDGYQFAFVRRLIPDLTFDGSTASSPTVTMKLYARDFPAGAYDQETDEPITKASVAVPIAPSEGQKWLRLRGRQIAFRIESDALGVQWSLGIPRLDISPDGRK
jgi:hypothetical protein